MNTARRNARILVNIMLFVIGLILVMTLDEMNQPKQTSNERTNHENHRNAGVIDRTGHNHNGLQEAVKNLRAYIETL